MNANKHEAIGPRAPECQSASGRGWVSDRAIADHQWGRPEGHECGGALTML
jgi:hypothetical protein